MEAYNEIKNRQLQAMLEPVRDRLKKYSPEVLCRKAMVSFDENSQCFCLPSMGQEIIIHYPDFLVQQELEMWHYLTLLQYLDTADGIPLSGKWIGLQQMPGGLSRGRGFDKDIETMFERYFSGIKADEFLEKCLQLGGRKIEGKADVTAVIPYAPMFPVMVSFWESDDEFAASGKVLVDGNAEHYLTIEAAGGACSAVIQEIRTLQMLEK